MREFADLHLRPKSGRDIGLMVEVAQSLGFKTVALTISRKTLDELPKQGVKLLSRLDVDVSSQSDINESLKGKSYDIVAVRCLTKDAARRAARDLRVDVLAFPEAPERRREIWLDRHEAEVAGATGVAYEVNVSEIITAGMARLPKLLTQLRRDLGNAEHHSIPVILSSGAVDPLSMREPRAFVALAELLDIGEEEALRMISEAPGKVAVRHLERKGGRDDAG